MLNSMHPSPNCCSWFARTILGESLGFCQSIYTDAGPTVRFGKTYNARFFTVRHIGLEAPFPTDTSGQIRSLRNTTGRSSVAYVSHSKSCLVHSNQTDLHRDRSYMSKAPRQCSHYRTSRMKPPAFAASSSVNATQSHSAMQFTTSIALLAALATQACAAVLPHASIVVDKMYDVSTTSVQTTACSTGENGLLSRYPTFGDIPNFPFIGGAFAVEGFNSTNCGSCWELTFLQQDGKTNVVHVTAVNTAPPEEFVISLEAQEALTGAVDESHVPANVIAAFREVAPSICGLD